MASLPFSSVARLPLPGDNVAIATRRLERDTEIATEQGTFALDATVLEGHRFAIEPIAAGKQLLSWQMPFGTATVGIEPGQYVCNDGMLEALAGRAVQMDLPATPNFESEIPPFVLDAKSFRPGELVPVKPVPDTFMAYPRSGGRGSGTRNVILLLGTSSLTGGFVRALEAKLQVDADALDNVDAIVAVAHTEGAVPDPNNLELVLRTLAGFVIHSNTAAVLAVDHGTEPVNNQALAAWMAHKGYPIDHVKHEFLSLTGTFEEELDRAAGMVRGWYSELVQTQRVARSVSELKLALQCGGSDSFSGISGNPLAAWVAREIIRNGGGANLAETDELIGAEPYICNNVRDLATAREFLSTVEAFKARAARHGHSAEGNPSGGNKFRGLYNIFLKSIGAAMKRDPDVRLEHVLAYGQLMQEPGFCFMDSPGNDLESIAGQVASGCNIIFFVTGNGSITNFPFVPTVKIVTTTERFNLLQGDMDINAGQYLDGTPMDDLGRNLYARTLAVAGGERTVGEKAGHSQVQLWRDWALDSDDQAMVPPAPIQPGKAIQVVNGRGDLDFAFPGIRRGDRVLPRDMNLIVPTSLCSGQIAALAVRRLSNVLGAAGNFATVVHHEGCGVSSGTSEELYARTLAGYVRHPQVRHCLLMEHGCEKTHNDFMRHVLDDSGVETDNLGWASVQLDGGIAPVLSKVEDWFRSRLESEPTLPPETGSLEQLRIALGHAGSLADSDRTVLAELATTVAAHGGLVVVPASAEWLSLIPETADAKPTLAYAQQATEHGLHLMDCPTVHWVETLSGLGATGPDLILVLATGHPVQGHPFIPTVEFGLGPNASPDLDLSLDPNLPVSEQVTRILSVAEEVLSGSRRVRALQTGNIDFQITRGPTGISL